MRVNIHIKPKALVATFHFRVVWSLHFSGKNVAANLGYCSVYRRINIW